MAALWTIKCYVASDGTDEIQAWYSAQEASLQAKFDARMRALTQMPVGKWVRPYSDVCHAPCDGLREIRFEWKNIQYRILGCPTGKMEFTLLAVATEVGGKFMPRGICDTAKKRKNEVLCGVVTNEREFN